MMRPAAVGSGCRPRRARLDGVLALLVLLPTAAAGFPQVAAGTTAGEQDLYGRTVAAVTFMVEGTPSTAPALIALVDVRIGEPLTAENVRTSIYRLATRYEDARVEAMPTEGGVAVTFHVTPRHPIDRLEVHGDAGIPLDELRQQILRRYGGVPATVRPELIENQAMDILRDEGYLDAAVHATTVVRHDPEGATLELEASAGARAVIARTEIAGDSPLSPETIRKRTGAVPGAPYRRRAIDIALANLRDELSARGYYEALATHRMEPTPDGVVVDITVEAGPLVELIVEPDSALPGSREELIPIRTVGSADRDLLEDSTRRIEAALREDGYYRADVQVTEARPSPDRLVITFRIDRGPRFVVQRVDVPANLALPASLVADRLAIDAGDVFSETTYVAGVAQVLGEYRVRGYYAASAEPEVEFLEPPKGQTTVPVVLHPAITEGPRGVVTAVTVTFEGPHEIGEAELRSRMRSRPGQPYVDVDRRRDQADLQGMYEDRGFLTAAVSVVPAFGNEGRDVAVAVTVNEGPKVVVGEITVVGNEYVPEALIRERLELPAGTPLSPTALRDAQERLNRMGGFQRVTVTAEPGLEGEIERRVIVSVTEAPRLIMAFGGGVEGGTTPRTAEDGGVEDRIELSPRASFEIGRRYLFNRNTSANLFTRLTLKPRSAPGDPERDGRGLQFADYRVTGTYRELYAFGSETDLLLGLTAERAERTTFNVTRQAINAEALHRARPGMAVIGRYSLDFADLSNERIAPEDQLLIDRVFPQVRLSILSAGLLVDRRNDPLSPSRGTFAAVEYEMALRQLGSEVGYVKSFFEGRWFRNLDANARTVVAVRGQLGLAHGFLRTVPRVDENGQPILDPDGQPITDRVQDLPLSRRFFAGGGTSVRGFQLDRLGVREVLNPDGLSLGGNGLIVGNVEVRHVLTTVFGRSLAAVGFLDGGNVFPRMSDVRLDRLRGAAGFGVRVDSPLGPIRLDIGFKLDRQTVNGRREAGWEYHLSIGEAF
jgi:outer membrane protein assembly factor BamA